MTGASGSTGEPRAVWLREQIAAMDARVSELQNWLQGAQNELADLQARRTTLVDELNTVMAVGWSQPPPSEAPVSGVRPPDAPAPLGPALGPTDPRQPETSTRTVQNVLFVLGGLLLGTAAIAFTAVAWATFGEAGRAAVLASVTLLMLAIPLIALARGLTGTAETFAAVGLLLVLLDGYALWYIDIAGVQGMAGDRYAGIVTLVTAAVALSYRLTTRLVGPGFAALLVIQPALMLLVSPTANWTVSLAASASALVNVVAIAISRRGPATRALHGLAWGFMAIWLAVGLLSALAAELLGSTGRVTVSDRGLAGLAIVAVALVLVAGAVASPSSVLPRIAGGALVVALAIAVSGVVTAAAPGHQALLEAAVAAGLALLVAAVNPVLPVRVRPGLRVGSFLVTGVIALGVGLVALGAAADTVARSLQGDLGPTGPHPPATWQLPVAALLVALGFGVIARARTRTALVALAGLFAVLALPDSVALPWWAPAPIALAGAAVALAAALAGRTARATVGAGIAAAVLVAFAVLTAQAAAALSAWILAGVVLLGVGAAVSVGARADVGADRLALGGMALVVAQVSGPAVVGSAARAAGWANPQVALAAVVGLLAPFVILTAVSWRTRRAGPKPWAAALPRYAYAGFAASAVIWPAVATYAGPQPQPIYAAASLFALALGLTVLAPAETTRAGATVAFGAILAALPPAVVFAIILAPPVLTVVGGPFAWLGAVWSGRPAGVGLVPASYTPLWPATISDAVALAVLALASAAAQYAAGRSWARAVAGLAVGGPTAIIVALVATHAPWPAVPAATVLIGLIMIGLAGIAPLRAERTWIAAAQGIVYSGAGLAAALSTQWTTLVWLGAFLVTAAVLAAIGRSVGWRVAGSLAAVASAVGLAAAGGFAAELTARQVGFGVLGAAVLALVVDAWLGRVLRRRTERRALHAAAQAAGVVALLFTVGFPGYAAGVSVFWGLALGLRALSPGTGRAERARLAAIGAGYELLAWWLLLFARGVNLVEAYTLPLALVALLAGWAALRTRPELRSWVAYGPALAAGFGPSLAQIISVTGDPWRRLALGAAALGVVVLGSVTRRQAPVVIGGLVLIIVALHELVLLWQLLPGWIPLAVGGAVLVALAITYERRLRDLGRLRTALGRMS
jgi:hypothetical protein